MWTLLDAIQTNIAIYALILGARLKEDGFIKSGPPKSTPTVNNCLIRLSRSRGKLAIICSDSRALKRKQVTHLYIMRLTVLKPSKCQNYKRKLLKTV